MDQSAIYTYEKYSFRIFTLLMVLMTFIFMFNSGFIGGAVCILLGVLISISYQGIKIDPVKKTIPEVRSLSLVQDRELEILLQTLLCDHCEN